MNVVKGVREEKRVSERERRQWHVGVLCFEMHQMAKRKISCTWDFCNLVYLFCWVEFTVILAHKFGKIFIIWIIIIICWTRIVPPAKCKFLFLCQ